ncbi:MAG: hypothetical protein GY935_03420 [Gammaproteobacteria bacterium]|nr:hypothetical protein [Gammaproteobacteria bacterium]
MKLLLIILAFISLLSCNDADKPTAVLEQVEQQSVEASPVSIVAEVNGEVIMKTELEQMAIDMFGEYQASTMDDNSRGKLLESMVSTLALAQASVVELPKERLDAIENKTKRYRENLLVSEYIRANASPPPVTESMIADYYGRNLAQFGQSSVRKYQLITSRQALAVDQRKDFIKLFSTIKTEPTVQAIHQSFLNSGFQTTHQSGVADAGLLSKKLLQVIDSQPVATVSDIHFIDGVPYIVKVDEVLQKSAKPLNEVRASIRKTLAMAQLKEAVRTLSETVKQQASVTIH